VENKFGVLARVVDLFSTRGFNIDSLNVAETQDPAVSRMTLVVQGDEAVLEQVQKQLNKLIDTTKVVRFSDGDHVERELALIKVSTTKHGRAELMAVATLAKAEIVDVGDAYLTLALMGTQEEVGRLVALAEPFHIIEIARTGPSALTRGK
jgi:acetolactate synthase I/III small subunit